jgi:hypothetical protein
LHATVTGVVWQASGVVVEFREVRQGSRGRREKPRSRAQEKSCDGLAMPCGGGLCMTARERLNYTGKGDEVA